MPVTLPLSIRRGAIRFRRNRAATRVAAVSAIVTASIGILAAAQQDLDNDASARLVAGKIASGEIAPAQGQARLASFTPHEAPAPQTVPGTPAPWDLNHVAQEFVPPKTEFIPPKTVRPVAGVLTSTFGSRWGEMHAGLDFGDPLGAPISAVTDGVVIEAGPASGFGLWVRVQQDDGTVGVYGHVNEILAAVGQPVRAGDVIATVGNRGQSTGPHLHYEVHLPSGEKIDPLPWLAARGIDVMQHPG
ncbi:M23 family metallopeptidase [Nocardia sp. NBC_00508]|uniref:M23 family metallopeptidase n=1 Tax=Nocardia sp. NBC_00508 TaxID=2975992 RepID=UPI002E81EBF0|nr:M23 family metallopeptidase [Nocardia sp. NBC_00508]WUD65707.1 M23 family metallopeptidase [Nocardia sp. NBC_00508]